MHTSITRWKRLRRDGSLSTAKVVSEVIPASNYSDGVLLNFRVQDLSVRYADLHMHTPASDGSDSVQKRVEDADKKGLDTIAITDHDAINSDLDERIYVDEDTGVEVITGAEIKCEVEDTGIEILAYFLDPNSPEVNSLLERNSELREERILEMISNLNDVMDYSLEEDEVFSKVQGNPGRPHIAEALVEADEVEDVRTQNDAFDNYIGEECPAYLPTPKQDAEKVIDTVLQEGGVPVLAHPGRDLKKENAGELVGQLVEYGLEGIEALYSWQHKKENDFGIDFDEQKSRGLAEEYDLIWTGGSDCHGSETDKYLLGTVDLPYSQVQKLKERADAPV